MVTIPELYGSHMGLPLLPCMSVLLCMVAVWELLCTTLVLYGSHTEAVWYPHESCMVAIWELYGRNSLHISTVYGSMWQPYNSHVPTIQLPYGTQ